MAGMATIKIIDCDEFDWGWGLEYTKYNDYFLILHRWNFN
jgi:hypothetical protein